MPAVFADPVIDRPAFEKWAFERGMCADEWPAAWRVWQAAIKHERKEINRLRELASTCYAGLGGECNLPEEWLDALLAAANGDPFTTDGLLPFVYTPPSVDGG